MISAPRIRAGMLAAVAAIGLAAGAATPQPAAGAGECALVPQLRDVTVNQGLGSYRPLVRGKKTLVRFYLSLPQCAPAGASIRITGGTLTARQGTTTLGTRPALMPLPQGTFPVVSSYAAAPVLNSDGDPRFDVTGALLAPAATPGAFTATFSAAVSYQARASATAAYVDAAAPVVLNRLPGTTAAITAPVSARTSALRLLVVKMGDPRSTTTQWSAGAGTALAEGMRALGRVYPVPDGVSSSLLTKTGGIRYTINAGMLDLTALRDVSGRPVVAPGTRFCGTNVNYDAIKGGLNTYLTAWNANNPTATADRVVGVIDSAISDGANAGCSEGKAALGGQQAWIRVDPAARNAGPLLAMEVAHTFGLEPGLNPHSTATAADASSPGRAYDTLRNTFLSPNRTVMNAQVPAPWDNTSTLLELDDYSWIRCALMLTKDPACPAAAPFGVGSVEGVGADPTFTITGTSDGTAAGTRVEQSYFSLTVPTTADEGEYRLRQLDGAGNPISTRRVPTQAAQSAHDGHEHDQDAVTTGVLLFAGAVPASPNADRIELWSGVPEAPGSVLLYERRRGPPPAIGAARTGGGGFVSTTADGNQANPALSPDGRWIAYEDMTAEGVRVSRVNAIGTGAVIPDARQPAWSPDGGRLAYALSEFVFTRTVDLSGAIAVLGPEVQINAVPGDALGNPAWSPDGTQIAFNNFGELYRMPSAGGEPTRIPTARGASRPAWSPDGARIAFETSPPPPGCGAVCPGTTALVSRSTAGAEADAGTEIHLSISSDGSRVAFAAIAGNLGGVPDPGGLDVFVRDGAVTTPVSVTPAGALGTGQSAYPTISGDGRWVAFVSDSTELTATDANGNAPDVFVRDLQTGTTRVLGVAPGGTQPLAGVRYEHLGVSGDGRFIAFFANMFELPASGGLPQAFLHDRDADDDGVFDEPGQTATVLVSPGAGGAVPDGLSGHTGLDVSDDGRRVVFESAATNLVAGDTNGVSDAFVYDRSTGTTQRASVSSAGVQGNDATGTTSGPRMTPDGASVIFWSRASNLVAGDTNGDPDAFVRDLFAGATRRVSVATDGGEQQTPSNVGGSVDLSADGSIAAFASQTTNLPGAGTTRIYRHDGAGETTVVDASSAGVPGNGTAQGVAMSGNGRVIAFQSFATNLDPAATDGQGDIFVRRLGILVTASLPEIHTVTVAGADERTVSPAGAEAPTYAPGGRIGYARPGGVYSVAADGTGETLLFDAGPAGSAANPDLASGRLALDIDQGEAGRDLVVETAPTPDITGSVTGPDPEFARVDVVWRCDGLDYPVGLGVEVGPDGTFTAPEFEPPFACPGAALVVIPNDGFVRGEATPVDGAPTSGPQTAPTAAVYAPAPASEYLQWDLITATGAASDAEGAVTLAWTLAGPGITRTGAGVTVDFDPPADGWAPGTYTVTLTVTDAAGNVEQRSRTFSVLADADHDSVPARDEPTVCGGGGDLDPLNGSQDADGDGTVNVDERYAANGACVADAAPVRNRAPQVADTTAQTGAGEAVAIPLAATDPDPADTPVRTIVAAPAHGTLSPVAGGSVTYTPDAGFTGEDAFTWAASDGELTSEATVTVVVTGAPAPPSVALSRARATAQYTDAVDPVTVSVADADTPAAGLVLSAPALAPLGLSLGPAAAVPGGVTATVSGRLDAPAGTYPVVVTASDGAASSSATLTVEVTREDVAVVDIAPPTASVDGTDGDVDALALTATLAEAADGATSATLPAPGLAAAAPVSLTATPAAGGTARACTAATATVTAPGTATAACALPDVPADVYQLGATVGGDRFAGSGSGSLVVDNPSLGMVSGGVRFTMPDDGSRASIAFRARTSSKGAAGGALVAAFRRPAGTWVAATATITSLKVASTSAGMTATVGGKTLLAAPVRLGCGLKICTGYPFTLYVEDRRSPGAGADRIWIQIRDPRSGAPVTAVSLPTPQAANARTIVAGDIRVPR